MNKLLKKVFPPEFFTSPVYVRALALAVVYLGVALAQLFAFEKYPAVVAGWGLPGGQATAAMVAHVLPLMTVAALPFLISMRLRVRSRAVSGAMVIATPAVWVVIALWQLIMATPGANAGLFGATIHTMPGWWLVLLAILWLCAAVVCVRELPLRRK